MARDRKRAKQRRGSKPAAGARGLSQPLHHADIPAALEHTGEVDEFDAALIRGAGGVPAPGTLSESTEAPPETNGAGGGGRGARRDRGGGGGGGGGGRGDGGAGLPVPSESRQPLPARTLGFLRASWAELQRVQWPDRRQVTQATAVVIGFVAVAGAYFGVADFVAKEIVEAIL